MLVLRLPGNDVFRPLFNGAWIRGVWHLRHGRGWIVSGYFRDSHPKLATPSNISRKLRELEVSGELEVQYREGRAY